MVVINLDYAKFSVCKQTKHFSPDIWIQFSLILEYEFSVCLSMFGMKGERGEKQHEYFECYFWMHVTTDNFIEMKRNVQQCKALLTHFNHIHFFSPIYNHIDRAISCDCFFFFILYIPSNVNIKYAKNCLNATIMNTLHILLIFFNGFCFKVKISNKINIRLTNKKKVLK